MLEPDVTLTDSLLAVECLLLAVFLGRRPARSPAAKAWAIIFFLAICVGSIAGGTVHGFFPEADSDGQIVLWLITLNSIGVTALAVWMLGALVLFRVIAWRFRSWAYSQFARYLGLTGFVSREFWTAMVTYIPACLFLSGAVIVAFRRDQDRNNLLVLAGLRINLLRRSCATTETRSASPILQPQRGLSRDPGSRPLDHVPRLLPPTATSPPCGCMTRDS